jgi:hypothetical protein
MVSKSNIRLLFFLVSFCVLYVGCGSPPPAPSLEIRTSSPLPNAQLGKAYMVHLKASGGEMPLTWSGNPPANLKLEPHSGKITGSPDHTGSFRFEVTVSDNSTPARSDSKIFDLTINPNVPLAIFTQSTLPSAGIKQLYSKILQTTGAKGKLNWSSSNLTDDFALDPNTGAIKGIPERIGLFTFDVKVTDSANQCVTKRFVLGVLGITTDSPLPEATEGQEYSPLKPFTGNRKNSFVNEQHPPKSLN